MGPDLGNIKDVPSVLESFINGHGLDVESPRSSVSSSNMLEEIFSSIVRVGLSEVVSFSSSEVFNTSISLEV